MMSVSVCTLAAALTAAAVVGAGGRAGAVETQGRGSERSRQGSEKEWKDKAKALQTCPPRRSAGCSRRWCGWRRRPAR